MTKTCVANACRTKCASDKVCVPLGMLCDVGTGSCVSCLVSSDCPSGQLCQGGACQTAVCEPGKTTCVLNAITTCNAAGDGYAGAGTACDPRSCTVTAAGASCTDLGPGSGGSSGGGAGGSTGAGGAGGATGNPAVDPTAYLDVKLLASCDSVDNEAYGGFWWSAADGDGVIMPPPNIGFPASAFVTGADAYMGTSLHFTGSVMTGHALFGVFIQESEAAFNLSAYDGFSFWARAPVPTMVKVGLGQPNTEMPTCQPDVCYDHPSLTVQVGTAWSRIVVPFSVLVPDFGPNPNVPTTPGTVILLQWGMPPVGAFSMFIDEIYFVKHK
jgi:hypothetical protein